MNLPCFLIDFISKIEKPAHLKKLQIVQKIYILMFQVTFSDQILIKRIIIPSTIFCCWGKQIFKKMISGEMNNLMNDKKLGQVLSG